MGSGCGAVGRAVASDTRDLEFDSRHRHCIIQMYYSVIAETEAGNGPCKKVVFNATHFPPKLWLHIGATLSLNICKWHRLNLPGSTRGGWKHERASRRSTLKGVFNKKAFLLLLLLPSFRFHQNLIKSKSSCDWSRLVALQLFCKRQNAVDLVSF